MTIAISASVGYKADNRPDDVRKIHELLKRIAPDKGGPPTSFNPGSSYSAAVTDVHIYNFQVRHFGKGTAADAVVSPGRATLEKMNAVAGSSPGASPAPAPDPAAGGGVQPANVSAVMTATQAGHAYVKGYDGKNKAGYGRFRVPMYELRVGLAGYSGAWDNPTSVRTFKVIRFGVKFDLAAYEANELYDKQFKMVGPPIGEFKATRAPYLKGSWRILREYYIHDGPDHPTFAGKKGSVDGLAGALGCIEMVGKDAMTALDEHVRDLSFSSLYREGFISAAEADERITRAGSFRCVVQRASTPPLQPLSDFTEIGGPQPIPG